ncbi:hypothetical protein [Pseudoalteromonas marina]|uniref:Uncharacterized protein n=1 Tax=Pseudoalteromonas marina TaxID=267375 RepID=A0ABT9FGL0_9GAMM|nr:hypothetical protein [Pseudoalteromonas marina]MDP2565814.1 hypothetical protein [Pseudoalteromonas marina]
MSNDLVVVKVLDVVEIPNSDSTVINGYLGDMKFNENDPSNHIHCKIFVKSSNKSLTNISKGDFISALGKINNKKSKSGFMELIVNAAQLTVCEANSLVQLGLYPNKSEPIFITSVFLNNTGYEISARYDGLSTPYIENNSIKYANDERQLRLRVSKKSRAFKTINKFITKRTGHEIKEIASQEQLDILKLFKAHVELGFVTARAIKKEINGINGTNTYLNINIDSINLFKQINSSEGNSPKTKTDDVPFGTPQYDSDGIAESFPDPDF